jgi:glycerate kinase
MRVVAALDSFKGSVDSTTAGEAVRAGVLAAAPSAEVVVVPVADGGEGTLEAAASGGGATWVEVDAVDAVGRPLRAPYVVLADGTVVVEAARTVGLAVVGELGKALPPRASSAGVGIQLRHALAAGDAPVLLGLGGSACTDGGLGLLVALGTPIETTTAAGNPLWGFERLGGPLPDLSRVTVLSDVTNPLCGPDGAAAVFAPQKGADDAQVAHLEVRLRRWAAELERAGRPVAGRPGAGAAGGLGAALLAGGATVEPGFDRLAALTRLADLVAGADLVITGEGSLDHQTAMGKAPLGVARLARACGAVVVGLGGRVDRPAPDWLDAVFPVHARIRTPAEALDPATTRAEIAATAAEVVRLVEATVRRSPASW